MISQHSTFFHSELTVTTLFWAWSKSSHFFILKSEINIIAMISQCQTCNDVSTISLWAILPLWITFSQTSENSSLQKQLPHWAGLKVHMRQLSGSSRHKWPGTNLNIITSNKTAPSSHQKGSDKIIARGTLKNLNSTERTYTEKGMSYNYV